MGSYHLLRKFVANIRQGGEGKIPLAALLAGKRKNGLAFARRRFLRRDGWHYRWWRGRSGLRPDERYVRLGRGGRQAVAITPRGEAVAAGEHLRGQQGLHDPQDIIRSRRSGAMAVRARGADVDELAVGERACDLAGQLRSQLQPAQVEIGLPGRHQGFGFLADSIGLGFGDSADARCLGAAFRLLLDDVLLGIGLGLRDLVRRQFRFALLLDRRLLFRFRAGDGGAVGGDLHVQCALLVVDLLLRFELGDAGTLLLLRLHHVGAGFGAGRRFPPPGLRDFAQDGFNVEAVERKPQVPKFAGAGVLDDDGQLVVLAAGQRIAGGRSRRDQGRGCRRRTGACIEQLIVPEQVDGAAAGGREYVGQRRELLHRRLGEEFVGGRVDHRVVFPDADDGGRADRDLDGRGPAVGIHVGRLVGDLDVYVDGLGGNGARLGKDRHHQRFGRATEDAQPAAFPPVDQQDLAGVYAAQKGRHDDPEENKDGDDCADNDP